MKKLLTVTFLFSTFALTGCLFDDHDHYNESVRYRVKCTDGSYPDSSGHCRNDSAGNISLDIQTN